MRSVRLDALRGIAILGMVVFHANYLLEHVFLVMNFHFSDAFWSILGKGVAVIFIIVSGISFFLATRTKTNTEIIKKSLIKILILCGIAGMISYVTYSFFYEQRIFWGIIHFFALASFLGIFFRRFGTYNIILGMIIIFIGSVRLSLHTDTYIFIPFGVFPQGYFSADYYPLIPWFGYYLLGYGGASFLDSQKKLHTVLEGGFVFGNFFSFIGKHSLLIYVIHVPIIAGVLSLFF